MQVVPASQGPDCASHDGEILQGAAPQSAAPREGPGRDDDARHAGAPARVTVSLPADGRLFVDGVPVEGAAGGGTFLTPELEKGRQYEYEVRAEVVIDGKVVSQTRRLTIGAGDLIRADFSTLGKGPDVTAMAR